jgi:hypothetical protein
MTKARRGLGTRAMVCAGLSLAPAVAALGCHSPASRPDAPLARVQDAGQGPPGPPAARWRGDFETATLSQWSYLLNPRGLSIVETPVADGRYAARVELQAADLWPNGLNRVEVQYKPPRETLTEGRQSCFAWSFFLPASLSGARHQIAYWESYPSYKQVMSFEVRGRAITFVTRMPFERAHWTAPDAVTPNVWHRIGMCARWSTDPAVGVVDVWFDGRQVVDHGAARTLGDNPDNPNLVQLGILRDVPAETEIMFLDAALEGPSIQSVDLRQ